MLQETNSAHECWTERDGAARAALTRSVFPDDALALICKPARSAMTSGKARTRDWNLRFEPRSRPLIEPLMGWTGCYDTLSQVELTFPSAAAAVAYARRQGLRYILQGADDLLGADTPEARPVANLNAANANSSRSGVRPWRLEWVERTLGLEGMHNTPGPACGPAARYASPQDVLHDRDLSPVQKRNVLRRWALDAYLIELALFNGEPRPDPSRLDEVIDALFDLDETQASTSAQRTLVTARDCEGRAA
jgi:ETC complex I subunit-like protein